MRTEKKTVTIKCDQCGAKLKSPVRFYISSFSASAKIIIGEEEEHVGDRDFCDEKCFCEYFTEIIRGLKNGS